MLFYVDNKSMIALLVCWPKAVQKNVLANLAHFHKRDPIWEKSTARKKTVNNKNVLHSKKT